MGSNSSLNSTRLWFFPETQIELYSNSTRIRLKLDSNSNLYKTRGFFLTRTRLVSDSDPTSFYPILTIEKASMRCCAMLCDVVRCCAMLWISLILLMQISRYLYAPPSYVWIFTKFNHLLPLWEGVLLWGREGAEHVLLNMEYKRLKLTSKWCTAGLRDFLFLHRNCSI